MNFRQMAAACGISKPRKKLDKDRFRQGLGDVVEGYEEVARRIGVPL